MPCVVKICFIDRDHRTLGNIDPDINYLSANNGYILTPYYADETFVDKYGNINKLSMFQSNIRSVPDHILIV